MIGEALKWAAQATYAKHDLPCIRRPSAGQVELLRLYNRRNEQLRKFPGVDIDRIHFLRGAVAPHLRSIK